MELEKISENLDKMVEKFQEVQEQNNQNISKKMFYDDKLKEARKEVDKLAKELLDLGVNVQEEDYKESLEKEFQEFSTVYMNGVSNVNKNKKIIEEVEEKLGSRG